MKKLILFSVLVLMIGIFSCKKDEVTRNKADITNNNWNVVQVEVESQYKYNIPVIGEIKWDTAYVATDEIDECELDFEMNFKEEGTITYSEGSTYCGSTLPDTETPWSVDGGLNKMTIESPVIIASVSQMIGYQIDGSMVCDILDLTSSRMVLKYSMPMNDALEMMAAIYGVSFSGLGGITPEITMNIVMTFNIVK